MFGSGISGAQADGAARRKTLGGTAQPGSRSRMITTRDDLKPSKTAERNLVVGVEDVDRETDATSNNNVASLAERARSYQRKREVLVSSGQYSTRTSNMATTMFGAVRSSMMNNSIFQQSSKHAPALDDFIQERSIEEEQASVIYGT